MNKYLLKCFFLGVLVMITPSCYKTKTMIYPPLEEWLVETPEPRIELYQMAEFEEKFANLFELHGVLLNDAILAALNDASEIVWESSKTNLVENMGDLSALFSLVYGTRLANRFEELFNQHIEFELAYIKAVKDNNPVLARLISKWALANGDMITQFLSIINPFFSYKSEQIMFEEHIELETQQIHAYFKGEISKAEEIRDRFINQLREIAGHIAKSMTRQMASEK